MSAPKWPRFRERWRREMLLRGSPFYRLGVWIAGLGGGLFWIWRVEKEMPVERRRIFLPFKRQIPMKEDEISRWNASLTGKTAEALLPVPPKLSPHTPEGNTPGKSQGPGDTFRDSAPYFGRTNENPQQHYAASSNKTADPLTADQQHEKGRGGRVREDATRKGISMKRNDLLFRYLKFREYDNK